MKAGFFGMERPNSWAWTLKFAGCIWEKVSRWCRKTVVRRWSLANPKRLASRFQANDERPRANDRSYGDAATKIAPESLAEANPDPWTGPNGQRACSQQARIARHDHRGNG